MTDAPARSRSGLDPADLAGLVSVHEPLFAALSGASVLLTGATGWFGTWLLDTLCAADDLLGLGLAITAVSRRPRSFTDRHPAFAGDRRLRWIEADIRGLDLRHHGAAVGGRGGFTHIIHAATDSSAGALPVSPGDQFDTIVEGTRRALGAADSGCRGVLVVSSGAIYGPAGPDSAGFREGLPGGPDPAAIRNVYAEGKRAAEQLGAIAAAGGLPVRIARCFAFVGPHMPFDRHFAIGNFIADAVAGRPIAVRSDGRPLRSYLYMTDLVAALLCVLVRGSDGRAYNVGSETAISVGDLARLVDRVVGGRGVSIGRAASDPADRYLPDIGRLRTELGFAAAVDLDSAVAKTAAWYRVNVPGRVS